MNTSLGHLPEGKRRELAFIVETIRDGFAFAIGRRTMPNLRGGKLLKIILRHACDVTNADAGSIYIVEGHDEDLLQRKLRFEASQNDSRTLPDSIGVMSVSTTSIVGQCVLSSDRINIPNLYALDPPGGG